MVSVVESAETEHNTLTERIIGQQQTYEDLLHARNEYLRHIQKEAEKLKAQIQALSAECQTSDWSSEACGEIHDKLKVKHAPYISSLLAVFA